MSNSPDDAARPAKRARLDNDCVPTFSASNAAPAATLQSISSAPAGIDAELEREVRAGIMEYVCPDNLGFTGVLKQRYTDFLVNEIGLDGQVLHLRSTEVEAKKSAKATEVKEDAKPTETGAKDEKIDTDMKDAETGEATLPVPVAVPAETKNTETNGEEILGQVKATGQEAGETVSSDRMQVLIHTDAM